MAENSGSGLRVGYAPGVYDLFHVGHLNILVPLNERLEIVRSCRFVDEAVAETLPDKLDTWRQTPFDILFKGDDWRGTKKGERLERDFATVGVEIVYFPYTVQTSSTLLRRVLDGLADVS
jgi:glycerol-3-phosphate cytidylyltransferase